MLDNRRKGDTYPTWSHQPKVLEAWKSQVLPICWLSYNTSMHWECDLEHCLQGVLFVWEQFDFNSKRVIFFFWHTRLKLIILCRWGRCLKNRQLHLEHHLISSISITPGLFSHWMEGLWSFFPRKEANWNQLNIDWDALYNQSCRCCVFSSFLFLFFLWFCLWVNSLLECVIAELLHFFPFNKCEVYPFFFF